MMNNCEVKIDIYYNDFDNYYQLETSDDGITKIKQSIREKNNYIRYSIKHRLGEFEIENFSNETIENFLLSDDLLENALKKLDKKFPKYDSRYLTLLVKVEDLYNIIFSHKIIQKISELNLEINLELR